MSTTNWYTNANYAVKNNPSSQRSTGIEIKTDNIENTSTSGKITFDYLPQDLTSGKYAAEIKDPYLMQAIEMHAQAEAKLNIAREEWSQSFKQLTKELPTTQMSVVRAALQENPIQTQTSGETSAYQADFQPVMTEGNTKAQIASDYKQNTETKNSAMYKGTVKVMTGMPKLAQEVVYEAVYLGTVGFCKLLGKDCNQWILWAGEKTGFNYNKYLPQEVVESLNPS